MSGIVARKGYFIIREHQCFPWYDASEFRHIGSVEGGTVFEQTAKVSKVFAKMNLIELTNILRDLADRVNLVVFASHPRAPKNARRALKRTRPSKRPHVSTAKILSQKQYLKTDTLKGLVLYLYILQIY
ncbi:hypothetical protein [uncultured Nostoc sp.]|uniref:hypothetical protein n=1 Tax=uncultured Nostoc sp. TaxID=340711 RepID=UPI00262527CD|nr:hypothetical protein [uncultured Nostoc sp.]